ncbi:MAG: oligoendopeptidase F [Clostridiales bacterium]|jgi:oligoendopeptidase F|nr:oligoendopeptidase F [Clostridiales bacterium]
MEKIKKRSEMDPKYIWDLSDIFESDADWEKAFEESVAETEEIAAFSGKFTQDKESLISFLDKLKETEFKVEKNYVYAQLRSYEDLANDKYQNFSSKGRAALAKFLEKRAFVRPELLAIDSETLTDWVKETKYKHMIEDILRTKPHVLPKEQEELLSAANEILTAPENIYSLIDNVDLKFPPIKDENGKTVEVTHGRYTVFLTNENREVRKAAFASVHGEYKKLQNSIAEIYQTAVKADIFMSRARKYSSSMDMYLSQTGIPVDVYKSLIKAVHQYIPSMKKYVSLRKKVLGIDKVHAYDLIVPVVSGIDVPISYEESQDLLKKALAPLGETYIADFTSGLNSKWVDVYENEGKRSGAYQWGVYRCHPAVSINYTGTLDSVFTFAHEMGHAMHSFYSDRTHDYVNAGYPIFLAEIASTVNENILSEYLIKNAENNTHKAFHINNFIDSYRSTVFRQTMFAEFEMIAHEKAEAGEPLTPKLLSEIYADLLIQYYGDDFEISDSNEYEWARIPHFYSPFYVYQYSTGFSAALAFSQGIIAHEDGVLEKYLEFLKAGGSDFPIKTLQKAGLDMLKPDVVIKSLQIFEQRVNDLDELL